MENTFAQIFYSTISNDVYNLGISNEQYIRDTISNNYELLLNEYQNKNDIEKNDVVQYFTNLSNIKKMNMKQHKVGIHIGLKEDTMNIY